MNDENRIDRLKAALEKTPDNPLARYGLANEYYKLGLYHEAIAQINEYLKIADDQGAVYRMLAECYLNVGDSEMAREAYFRGMEAATKHGHPGMAEEFEEAIDMIED